MYKQILSFLIFAYVVLYLIVPVRPLSNVLFDLSMVVVVVAVVLFFRYSQSGGMRSQWAKPSNLLLISYLAVNMQYLLDYRFGLKNNLSDLIIYPSVFNQCIILAVAGLLAFVLGYCWKNYRVKETQSNVAMPAMSVGKNTLFFLSLLQMLIFGLFLANVNVMDFFVGKAYIGGTRESTLADYFEALLYVVNAVIVIVVIFGRHKIGSVRQYLMAFPNFSLYLMLVYMLLRMVSGDRGPFIYTALLLFYGYLYAVRRSIKLAYIASVALAGAVFISLIGIARQMDSESQSFSERISAASESFSQSGRFSNKEGATVFTPTEELGFSFLVNQVAVNDVVNHHGSFHYGAYQLFGMLNSIPFVPGFLKNQLHLGDEQVSSGGRANLLYLGRERTWGTGSTMLADFFWDLGIIGVILGMFVTGLLFHYIDYSLFVANKSYVSAIALACCLMYAAKSIYIPRSTLLFEMKDVVWGGIFLYFCGFLGNRKKRKI